MGEKKMMVLRLDPATKRRGIAADRKRHSSVMGP
jgi:hypothetical protein